MHSVSQKPVPAQETKVDGAARSGNGSCGQHQEVGSILYLQQTIGNQAVQRMFNSTGEEQPPLDEPPFPDTDCGQSENNTGMPAELKSGLESLSGLDLSGVRVHRNSPEPARINARAYTQGLAIHLAPGQERHLPHEGWHTVQQLSGRVNSGSVRIQDTVINNDQHLEAEAESMGRRAASVDLAAKQGAASSGVKSSPDGASRRPVQREVRIDNGRTRVPEIEYKPGGPREAVGSKYSVDSLIHDGVRRVFDSVGELECYADGFTDYIGEVVTSGDSSAGIPSNTYWYRLPENGLTVLGERHSNPEGNVEDVILGLQTSRFMYEPFNEFTEVSPFTSSDVGSSTQTRLTEIDSTRRVAGLVDRAFFDPDLENIIIKAMTGASITRNEFIAGDPPTMDATDQQTWGSRPTTDAWSYGERVALYLSMAIHIAEDISHFSFGIETSVESNYFNAARRLMEFYVANKAVLDTFAATKDSDDLIGIYEITAANGFADLTTLSDFTLVFHEYAARYIEQLGAQMGNTVLETEGQNLSTNLGATLHTLSPAREEIMWERVQHAYNNCYLLVGMGDRHRLNLEARLNKEGIPHDEVVNSLKTQEADINTNWVP